MKYKRVMAGALAAAMTVSMGLPVQAASKNDQGVVKTETVYVKADKTGNVKETIVSDWLQNVSGKVTIKDNSSLNQIKNVKGDETFKKGKNGSVTWEANGNDIYYQGTTSDSAPVTLKAEYWLDGEKMDPEDLEGKSGSLKIKISSYNKEEVPFTVISILRMKSDQCKNIQLEEGQGKVISDGKNDMVAGIMMPGLMDQLDLDTDKNVEMESLVITADVTDFEPSSIYNVATNGLLNDVDLDDKDEVTDLLDTLKDSSKKLVDGSETLSDSLGTLSDKAKQYTDGVNKYIAGVNTYTSGVSKVASGMGQLASGSGQLVKGSDSVASGAKKIDSSVATLLENMQALQSGAGQVSNGIAQLDAVLAQGQKELEAKASELATKKQQVETLIQTQTQLIEGQQALIQAQKATLEQVGADSSEGQLLQKTIATEENSIKVAQTSIATEKALLETIQSSANEMNSTLSAIRGYTGKSGSLRTGSAKVAAGELVVVEGLAFDAPKTKQVASLLKAFEAADQKALLITDGANENVALSARNMPKVTAITNMGLNCFDILNSKKVFLAKDVVEKIEEVLA